MERCVSCAWWEELKENIYLLRLLSIIFFFFFFCVSWFANVHVCIWERQRERSISLILDRELTRHCRWPGQVNYARVSSAPSLLAIFYSPFGFAILVLFYFFFFFPSVRAYIFWRNDIPSFCIHNINWL